jgi:hypothetical protein
MWCDPLSVSVNLDSDKVFLEPGPVKGIRRQD